ncbi:hypothetical protein GCM10011581_44340 [Saccharopolyspora subtropica]|uniref:Uncharacterized protein n=1 Tax=Saccharopolyspora thermophila TaxID=89367 RepID=A0A917K6Y8_9PSEU|nr:hypothetical protein [Saccharopolyspora subtropica]GGJ02315.1 hypothetical protein GCM10011581_44340 [Saccharopolyspora subtropica]
MGLLISAVTRLAPWTPLPAEVGALATAVQLHPKLRRLVEQGLRGREQAESVLPVVSALAQGVATRGGGLVLDVAERWSQWREADADRAAWAAAEPRLVRGPDDAAADPIAVPRPGPPHRDVLARYTERAMAVAVACGAAATPYAGPRRGLAVALAGEPKAPDAGREGFATTLGRYLARRGAIAMDRGALRRLGQVDTVVLDEDALRGDRYEPADLVLVNGTELEAVAERLYELFHPTEPDRPHRDADGWVLGPLEDLDLTGRTGRQAAARLRRSSDHVLGLARGRRLQAVAGVVAQTMPGTQALTAAVRRSGARLVLASDHTGSAFGFVDAVVHTGRRLLTSVCDLQADGAVVLLVSGNRAALGASDCGIGVHRDGDRPAWGADVLVGTDLEAVTVIVDGVGVARCVATRTAPCSPRAAAVSVRSPRCRHRPPGRAHGGRPRATPPGASRSASACGGPGTCCPARSPRPS